MTPQEKAQRLLRWTRRAGVYPTLVLVFPKMETNSGQHQQAVRWATILHLRFGRRRFFSRVEIAAHLGLSLDTVKGILRSYSRASRGQRTDTKGKRGRPRTGRRRIRHF